MVAQQTDDLQMSIVPDGYGSVRPMPEQQADGPQLREPGGREPRMPSDRLEAWLRRQIASRRPAAVVRFGDGEERLLDADAGDSGSLARANGQLRKQTGRDYPRDAVLEVKAAVEHAYREADVLGIHDAVPVLSDDNDTHVLAARYRERVAAGRPPAVADAKVNHALLGALPDLLAGRRVSVISCRDVRPIMESQWGLEDVAVHQVPSQHVCRDLDGAYEAAMHGAAIWPDVHHRIASDLTVREPGEVFLIGAGVFGKDLCIRVRERGGIALDMGAALDHMTGKLTRVAMRQIMELHAAGASVPEIATSIGRPPADHDGIAKFIDIVSRYVR